MLPGWACQYVEEVSRPISLTYSPPSSFRLHNNSQGTRESALEPYGHTRVPFYCINGNTLHTGPLVFHISEVSLIVRESL